MKQLITAVLLTTALSSVHAGCNVPNSTLPYVRDTVSRLGGWPISDEKCALLNAKKLSLRVSAQASVLAGVSVGWASVSLKNRNSVHSELVHSSTYVNSKEASTPEAEELMVLAIRDAIGGLDFETAAKQVAELERKAK